MKSYKKNKSKVNKEIKRSERKKYLDTMMADMGISSLSELSSNEERKKWLKAVMPSKSLERKLKEMGYDLSGSKNKKSLGSRRVRLLKFRKLALASGGDDIDFLIQTLGPNYSKIVRFIIPNPIIFFSEARGWLDPEAKMREARAGFAAAGVPMTPEVEAAVKRVIENGSSESMAFINENPISETIGSGQSLSPEDLVDSDLNRLSKDLSSVGIQTDSTRSSVANSIITLKERFGDENPNSILTGEILGLLAAAVAGGSIEAAMQQRESSEEEERLNAAANQSGLSSLANVDFARSVDFSRVSRDLMMAIVRMDSIIEEKALSPVTITSLFRSDFDQARVMLENYNRMKDGNLSGAAALQPANDYMIDLYGESWARPIIDIYQKEDLTDDEKIRQAEAIISQRPKTGHRLGRAMDVVGNMEDVSTVAKELEKYFVLRSLREDEPGPHYHISITRQIDSQALV